MVLAFPPDAWYSEHMKSIPHSKFLRQMCVAPIVAASGFSPEFHVQTRKRRRADDPPAHKRRTKKW